VRQNWSNLHLPFELTRGPAELVARKLAFLVNRSPFLIGIRLKRKGWPEVNGVLKSDTLSKDYLYGVAQ